MGKKNIFVYGSLMIPEMVKALTGNHFLMVDAILPGYRRHKVKDHIGPGLSKEKRRSVYGKVLLGIDEKSMAIFDKFEGSYGYELIEVEVLVEGHKKDVFFYEWTGHHDTLLDEDWDVEEFKRKHMERFLKEEMPKFLRSLDES